MVVELDTAARLRYVVTSGLLLALAFIANGIYVFVTGFQPPGLSRRLPSARRMGPLTRLWGGLIPSFIGSYILTLLIVMAARRHVPPLTVVEWLKTRSDSFPGIFCLGGAGIWFLIRPGTVIKWVHQSRQTAASESEQRGELLTVRLLSAMLLGMAVLMLATILWTPANVP